MSKPLELFDRRAVLRNRARAVKIGFADFLHAEALFEIQERLLDVNRQFTSPAIVTGFPNFWGKAFPDAKVIPDDSTLDLEPQAHDLLIHAMCLHQSNDPVGQVIQCRNALKPDGLILTALLGGSTLTELRSALSQAEIELAGGLSPRVSPMAEIRDLGSILQRSKLALPVADTVKRTVSYSSVVALLHDLRAMGETNTMRDRPTSMAPRKLFAETARIYGQAFGDADRITASFEMIFMTGWAPSVTQPKPLQPGSAKARLADALSTTELGTNAKSIYGDEDSNR